MQKIEKLRLLNFCSDSCVYPFAKYSSLLFSHITQKQSVSIIEVDLKLKLPNTMCGRFALLILEKTKRNDDK